MRVVEHVLVGDALAAAIGGGEFERALLAHAVIACARVGGRVAVRAALEGDVGELAVNLVGAGEDDGRCGRVLTQGLEDVQRARGVDGEIVSGILHAGGDGDLGGEMEDGGRVADLLAHRVLVAYVGDDRVEMAVPLGQPVEVARDAGTAEVVKDDDVVSVIEQTVGEIAADKAATSEDDGVAGGTADPW